MGDSSLNIELYGQIGIGRKDQPYQPTVTYKGRIKQTIEFVAAKSIDIKRKDEVFNYAEIVKPLEHPNVVKFHHWYQTGHHFWIIQELCPGGTLLELLDQDKRLPESIIRIFGSDILSALLYLHKHGIIYRDLQPRNIMLDECGSLKLNDFTHAERLERPFDLENIDQELTEYMAPELFNEQGVASFSSDHWALGCLLYRMASGTTPFLSTSQEEMLLKIHDFQPPHLSGYSAEFNDLIQRLLQKDCFQRINWEQIIAHSFWKDVIRNRSNFDPTFNNFNLSQLPIEPRISNNKVYKPLERKASTITINVPKIPNENQTQISGNNSIENYILSSTLLSPQPLIFNPNIEEISLPPFDQFLNEFPITSIQLISKDIKEKQNAISQILSTLKSSNIRPKKKFPFISFLINQAKNPEISTTLAT
ncbi:CAMK family protein kinase [Histomonas meleagridis]|uniref:CAMK family protein kinase n=1 Tax=Histomonas meleagridis TaxID=135588 RepID=UPI00355A30D2|nr:CAMK family protein kinase [Histomonas meleagridis]KAH0804935.1 CAMK family protein kinase [Histomonas meleagridis]